MFEFLKCISISNIENIAEKNNLSMVESDDYEVGKSTIKLEDESGELQAHFVLSGASPSASMWRCIFVEKQFSLSNKTES